MKEDGPKATSTHRMMLCPGCGQEISIQNEYIDSVLECTLCGKHFRGSIKADEKRRAKRDHIRNQREAAAERQRREVAAAQELQSMSDARKQAAQELQSLSDDRKQAAQELQSLTEQRRLLEEAAHGAFREEDHPGDRIEDLLDRPEAQASPVRGAQREGEERSFHLITIRGKPLWVGLTLVVIALSVVSYLSTRPDRDAAGGVSFDTWRSRLVEAGYFPESSDFDSQILRGRRTAVRSFVHDANNAEKARIGLHTTMDDHDKIVALTMSYRDEFLGALERDGSKDESELLTDIFVVWNRKSFIAELFRGLAGRDPLSLELRPDPDIDPEGGKVHGIHFGEKWTLEVILIGDDTTFIIARQW